MNSNDAPSDSEVCLSFNDSPILGSLILGGVLPVRDLTEQINRLRGKRIDRALVPVEVTGAFRLVGGTHTILDSNGLTLADIVQSLRDGLDIVQVDEPNQDGDGKSITGCVRIGESTWSVRLSRPRPRPTTWDWEVTSFANDPPDLPAAMLVGEWIPEGLNQGRQTAGDPRGLMARVEDAGRELQQALDTNRSHVVDLGTIGLSISKTLRSQADSGLDSILDALNDPNAEILACSLPPNESHPQKFSNLSLWFPDAKKTAILKSSKFGGPNDLLLHGLSRADRPPQDATVCLKARWLVNTTIGECSSAWREVIQGLIEERTRLIVARASRWNIGPFRLRTSKWVTDQLSREGLTLQDLCEDFQAGIFASPVVTRYQRDALRIWTVGALRSYHLTPRGDGASNGVGAGDWYLTKLVAHRGAPPQPFARLKAEWSDRTGPADRATPGDRDHLLASLSILFQEDQSDVEKIERCRNLLAGFSPKVVEKARLWKELTDLERSKYEVGVASIRESATEEGIFFLTVNDPKRIKVEIDRIVKEEADGQVWERYPLHLFHNPKQRDLFEKLDFAEGNDWQTDELRIKPSNPERIGFLRRIVEKWNPPPPDQPGESSLKPRANTLLQAATIPDADGPGAARLYHANTEWNRVDEALKVFNPAKDGERAQMILQENTLAPSHLTLNKLRRVLINPLDLTMAHEPPELPWKPMKETLSPAQRRAVAMAVSGIDLSLIHGPPGTGKTTVIVEVIRQLFLRYGKDPNFRVLLVAPTHVAVDNVLTKLLVGDGGKSLAAELGVTPYRLGPTSKVAEHLQPHLHDCFHSSFLKDLSDAVDVGLFNFESSQERDQRLKRYLERGVQRDLAAWSKILKHGGAWPDSQLPRIPEGLTDVEENDALTQEGRLRLWRNRTSTKTAHPRELLELLREWKAFIDGNQGFINELQAASANLFCATTVGCSTTPALRGARYSYVIVDEAGKEESRKLLVALLRGERWILVGDHKQLPPFADDTLKKQAVERGLPEELLTRSLFEELQPALEACGRYVLLDHQGRMHPEISKFVSRTFYDGKLEDFPNTKSHTIIGPSWFPSTPALQLLDTRQVPYCQEQVWENPEKTDKKISNWREGHLAIRLALAFTSSRDWGDRTIGIIAPYGLQARRILRRVERNRSLAALHKKGTLKVGTVDSFQGEERDLILFSCTRSNPQGAVGFVDNLQRLNVALSRAKARLIVIADGQTLDRSLTRTNVDAAEADVRSGLKDLFKHVRTHGGYIEIPANWRPIGREHPKRVGGLNHE